MAHELDMTGNRSNIAFLGSRNDIWHRQGQEMQPGQSIQQWAKAAGLDWTAVLVPALASLEGAQWDHIAPHQRFMPVDGQRFICRSDNGYPLGYASDGWQAVQPLDLLEWFDRYISVDPRFELDVAGSLRRGARIWATATFRDPLDVAGDKHVARVLMSTTFDTTQATINQGTMTRVVCNNTLTAALADTRAVVRTRHSTRFDPARVGRELAAIANGFAVYKSVGDAMAQVEMTAADVSSFFKQLLDIPSDAKKEDVSTRKMNQYADLSRAWSQTARERGRESNSSAPTDAWTALQAVTRYVDHDRTARGNGAPEAEKRFASSQFGSGAALKAEAWNLLMPRVRDKVPVVA